MIAKSTFAVKLTCNAARHALQQVGRPTLADTTLNCLRYGRSLTISSGNKYLIPNRPSKISSPAINQIHKELCLPHVINVRALIFGTSTFQQKRYYRTGSRHPAQKKNPESNKDESKDSNTLDKSNDKTPTSEEDLANQSVFQRFKQAYREHGKILIGVHLVTSSVWLGSFFYAASVGIDVVPWLEHIGISETLIKPFRSPNVGNIAMAYLMYKLATPARYTVTLGGTNILIRYMRRTGRMDHVSKEDTFRALYKEGREQIRENRHVRRKSLRHDKDGVSKRQ